MARLSESGIKESVIGEWKYDVVEEIYDGDLKYDPYLRNPHLMGFEKSCVEVLCVETSPPFKRLLVRIYYVGGNPYRKNVRSGIIENILAIKKAEDELDSKENKESNIAQLLKYYIIAKNGSVFADANFNFQIENYRFLY